MKEKYKHLIGVFLWCVVLMMVFRTPSYASTGFTPNGNLEFEKRNSINESLSNKVDISYNSDIVSTAQQSITISGRVTDNMGEPISGATIVIKGTSVGVISDENGYYSIDIPNRNVILVFSFLGFTTQELPVGNNNTLTVVLIEDDYQLEDIVVIGYGTQKRGNLTAAISTIKNEEILTTTHTSLAQRLQGKISGLQIRQYTGAPGDYDAMINIRGFGAPIFIIDGTTRVSGAEFQRLNPDDIENISILIW